MLFFLCVFFFFKQKTAYEMRISDWSSDVCSSDLLAHQADAVILSGDSASVKIFRDLVHADGIRLFDFTQGEAYERRFRYLNRFELPAGAFDLGENLPDHRITMMAPTVELLAHADRKSTRLNSSH